MAKKISRSERAAARAAKLRNQRIATAVVMVVLLLVLAYFASQRLGTGEPTQTAPPTQPPTSIPTRPAPSATPESATTPAPTLEPAADATLTPSGLQIQELAVGEGAEIKPGDTVSVHYTLWLADGTKIDSSSDRGQPFIFTTGAGDVIAGWDEGVTGMRTGGKRRLVIPPELAYGATGAGGGIIPPNATLVFEIETLEIVSVEIEDLVVGTGPTAGRGDIVSVHYTGWLEDGTKFDSSVDRGAPFEFQLGAGRVIQGWEIGVQGMQVGGKRRLTIPPELGYGSQGSGETIPPGATLIFEVELLGIRGK